MSLVAITFGLLLLITVLSIVIGSDFVQFSTSIGINNEAFVNGASNTYVVNTESVLFYIDASQLGGAIFILTVSMVALAGVLGITVLSSGLNTASVKFIVYAIILGGSWGLLSTLAFPLIISIEIFGVVLYVMLTIGFVVGSFQLISGSGSG